MTDKPSVIQRIPFSFDGIDADIQRLGSLLVKLIHVTEIKLQGKISVLNLACGRADETGVLVTALKPAEVGFYLGIDLRSNAIQEATQRWELLNGEINFREGNAALIGKIEGLQEFDLIFIRHQNYWHEPMVWEGILDEALEALKDSGYFVCTSYFDLEHEMLLASMRARGVKLLANIRHADSRDLPDTEGKSVDRWIALWAKV